MSHVCFLLCPEELWEKLREGCPAPSQPLGALLPHSLPEGSQMLGRGNRCCPCKGWGGFHACCPHQPQGRLGWGLQEAGTLFCTVQPCPRGHGLAKKSWSRARYLWKGAVPTAGLQKSRALQGPASCRDLGSSLVRASLCTPASTRKPERKQQYCATARPCFRWLCQRGQGLCTHCPASLVPPGLQLWC